MFWKKIINDCLFSNGIDMFMTLRQFFYKIKTLNFILNYGKYTYLQYYYLKIKIND